MSNIEKDVDIFKLLEEREDELGEYEEVDIYYLLDSRGDFLRHKPQKWEGIILKKLDFIEVSKVGDDSDNFILKNPKFESIYKIDEQSLFLWELMDGQHSVRDLLLAYYNKYGAFAYDKIVHLIMGLRKNMMLTEHYLDIYENLSVWAKAKSMTYQVFAMLKRLFSFELKFPKSDAIFTFLYKYWGRLILRPVCIYPLLVLSFIGLGVFVYVFATNRLRLFPDTKYFGFSLLVFWLLNTLVTLSHEISHGIVCKHYKCQVKDSGMMLYMGLPVAFVDTTDIWMASSRARILTSLAGPINDIIWAGLASLALLFVHDPLIQILIFQFAFINFVSGVLNLNPLWELDGYYILMDIVGIPLLRKKSFAFIKTQIKHRFKGIRTWTEKQKWFFGYGFLSLLWLIIVTKMFYFFWRGQVLWIVMAIDSGVVKVSTIIITIILLIIFLPLSLNVFTHSKKEKVT